MNYYIYCLIDCKTKEIRYIGQTKNIKIRMDCHNHFNQLTELSRWIDEHKTKFKKFPTVKILETVKDSVYARRRETAYIKHYSGFCNLLNKLGNKKRNKVPEK